MMDEEIRQALCEVREMKKMCGNINMKLTNIVTQRGQDYKEKLEAEYQREFEDGKAQSERGCEECQYQTRTVFDEPCVRCSNAYKSQWKAEPKPCDIIRNGIQNWITELNVRAEDIGKILEDMRHD